MTEPNEKLGADKPLDFIRQIVSDDLSNGKHAEIATRFPPEPNGFLHIGHAKSICLNFGIVSELKRSQLGDKPAPTVPTRCHLRFDDTNPAKEEQAYIDAIKRDVRWLGFQWDAEFYASDYFERFYGWAQDLIRANHAYVDDLSGDEIRQHRGTLTTPGTESPFRGRSAEESLDLFARMRAGEFGDGEKVLRARIDMASPNLNLRDPVLYRILHAHHPRTGDQWCIYPMYDFAHGQSDAIEGITHSLCTLEFEAHRPLYEWFLEHLDVPAKPRQIEFARLNLTHTMMSKRKLLQLVDEKVVDAWDDPRMPTIAGMRRRGYTAESIRAFCEGIGIAKRENTIELSRLEFHVREDLNKVAQRRMAVLNPLRVIITNYDESQVEEMDAVNNPENSEAGSRKVPFSRVLYIERDDFMEDPPRKFFRLGPGREVRLRYAYWVKCHDFVKDESGNVIELHCTYDPQTRGGNNPPPDEEGKVRKVKGTLHWVSAEHAVDAEVRLYDVLFADEDPGKVEPGTDWKSTVNPQSLEIQTAKVEPALARVDTGTPLQFERIGYFCADEKHHTADKPVFNRTVTLKDSWAKKK